MNSTALSFHSLSAQIATELAAGLSSEETLRKRFAYTEKDWEALLASPVFRRMREEAETKLSGPLNAKQRIRLKASIAFEESVATIYRMVHDRDMAGAARMEAAKLLAKVSEVDRGDEDSGGPASSGFSITINLGDQQLTLGSAPRVIDAPTYNPNADLMLGLD